MPSPPVGPSNTVAKSPSPYDMDNNFTLTQEEEAALVRIEEDHQAGTQSVPDSAQKTPITPTTSPTRRKKRKRVPSSERTPHTSPYKLRSIVKRTSRALDAGYDPNAGSAFRHNPDSNSGPLPTSGPGTAGVAPPPAGKSDTTELALAAQPVVPPVKHGNSVDPAKAGYPTELAKVGRAESLGYASDSGRRSESLGPMNPLSIPSGAIYHPAAAHHNGPSPIPYQPYPFQPYVPSYVTAQGYLFHNPALQRNNGPIMPTEGPNPSTNVFSTQYAPLEAPVAAVQSSTTIQSAPAAAQSSEPLPSAPVFRGNAALTDVFSTQYALLEAPVAAVQPSTTIQSAPAAAQSSEPLPSAPVFRGNPTPTESANATTAPSLDAIRLATSRAPSLQKELGQQEAGSKEIRFAQELAGVDSDDAGSNLSDSQLDHQDSPTIGRLTNAARHALRSGYDELDATVKRISLKTGLTPVQIVEQWDATKTRSTSSWNIYQGFFEERRETELERLCAEKRPVSGAIPDKAIISACYESFKAAKPDSYDDILRKWHRLRIMSDKGEMPISKRAREFKKHIEKVDNWIRQAANLYGFETLCITVGGVVNQDQNLAQIVTSNAATDFFLERFRSTDHLALGQMKAHVYDRLSRRMMDEFSAPEDAQASSSITAGVSSTATTIPSAPTFKSKDSMPATGDSNILGELKERFIALAAQHNIVVTKGSSLHWKGLPQIVADAGCVLVNWPEDVSFPCDEVGGKSTSKGIAILKNPARIQLLAAFDHPINPLHIKKKYSSAVPKNHPVIYGVPPDSTSPHAFGRRKFLDDNQNEDRKGPPRCKPLSSSRTGHASKLPSRTVSKIVAKQADELESSSDEDRPLVVSDSSEGELETPKAPKKNAPKVTFKREAQDSPYSMSLDGSPQYSGSDKDFSSLARSPLNLRSKASMKNPNKKKSTAFKQSRRGQTKKDQGDSLEARPSGKKQALESSAMTSTSVAAEASRSSVIVREAIAADIVAEKLFGGAQTHDKIATASLEPNPTSQNGNAEVEPNGGSTAAVTVPPVQAPRPPQNAMPPPQHQHHAVPPPLQHPTIQQQPSHLMHNPPHGVVSYPEGYYQPAQSAYPNATPYGVHPHAQIWYPPPSSSSNVPLSGPSYPGHPNGSFWPNQGPPMMYPNTFGHYPSHPQHMPPPQHDGMDTERSG